MAQLPDIIPVRDLRQETAAGNGHDLDDVLAEADAILARDRS